MLGMLAAPLVKGEEEGGCEEKEAMVVAVVAVAIVVVVIVAVAQLHISIVV